METSSCLDCAINAAEILYEKKKYKDSLYYFKKALKINPNEENSIKKATLILIRFDRLNEALKNINYIIKIFGKDTISYEYKGEILYGLKKYSSALEAFDRAIECNKKHIHPYLMKIRIFLKLKKYDDVKKSLEKAKKSTPKGKDELNDIHRFTKALKNK